MFPFIQRSPAPDLLFSDVSDRRVTDIQLFLDEPHQLDAGVPFHRVTVFLTYRCNLDCPYCKTIARSPEELEHAPHKRGVFTYETFASLLEHLADHPIEHLHLTGGEAATVRNLPRMIALAKACGVTFISMTSNGAVAPQRYAELVAAGLDELRISIDAADPDLGLELTGRRHAWKNAIATIQMVASLRDAGAPIFLILNTVVSKTNRHRLADIVRFLLSLRPDDLKLITAVDEREDLGDFPEAPAILAELTAMLAVYPDDALPLLRRKLNTVFAPDAIGLDHGAIDAQRPWRCYIPLTERTVDTCNYYPCSVYLREGGAPLGPLSDPPELQRARTADFVAHHNCQNDPICRRYCLFCTRQFNDAANAARESHNDRRV